MNSNNCLGLKNIDTSYYGFKVIDNHRDKNIRDILYLFTGCSDSNT